MENLPAGFGLICGGFFLLITLAIGVGLLFFSIRSRKKAQTSQNWPGTQGTVTVSAVRESSSTNDDGYTSTYYYPKVEYEYTVMGQPYTGKNISFGGATGYGNPLQVEPKLASYPVGAHVTVYYNPEKPSEAVLERKAGGSKFMMIVGIVLLVISLCIACVMLVGIIRNFM
jgi:hypothetical protein